MVASAKKTKPKTTDELIAFVEELKRQWVATIDALVDPLMIVSKDYHISKSNKALAKFAEDTPVQKLVGKTCYEAFAGRKSPCPGCKMLDAANKHEPTTFTISDIKGRYFEVTSQPVFDLKGDLEGVVQIYRDRTEARAMQEQLLQREKLASIGLLAGGFAHEINNPLGGALIFAQMILREMPKDSQFYQDVIEIENATQRCKGIVERLLEFARTQPSDVGKEKPVSYVLVSEAVKSALRFAKVSPQAKKIAVTEMWGKVEHPVKGDRNTLISLFLNLIQNAFQSMPDGGRLVLRESQKKEGGTLWGYWQVEDSGIGIEDKHLGRIFDPFFTMKEPGEGTGLGLSISYGICKELGGSLSVKSKINVGTTFTVKLPLSPVN